MLMTALVLAGCGSMTRHAAPESPILNKVASVPGQVRYWGDEAPKNVESLVRRREAQRAAYALSSGTINYLAISGGGSDGAFGAGFLAGWSAAGTRPKFDVVTGVSTGALIAPFAFLGSGY
ncbi:patatin-like phospholipase family protein, partial [Enterobacter hormaechei]|uniref:patatin-like phospholipase family protein n=1 Tax=Enterobacter hormaechei TaxID=158836 RepID=UPI00292EBD72